MNFTKLWDKTYLLGPNPIDLQRSDKIFVIISLVFILTSLLVKIVSYWTEKDSPKKFLLSRFVHLFLATGILVLFWSGSRFENIPLLSTHIVVISLFLIWVVWLVSIGRYFFKAYRGQQRLWEEERVKKKYLPR